MTEASYVARNSNPISTMPLSKHARTVLPRILILLLWTGQTALGQHTQPLYQDSLFTVETSETLTSWGRLGGVAVDRLGFVYVSNFHDKVWRIDREGHVEVLADGLYGASGNAIDSRGRLLQASFFSNTISRIDRYGRVEMLATEGLSGPVGIAVDPDDNFYVVNCRANAVTFVTDQGEVSDFARSELFACPNGIIRLSDGALLVTNFSNDHIVRVDTNGAASIFATLPTEKGVQGNAHLAIARDHVYVTRIKDNYIYRIALEGRSIVRVAGNGTPIDSDGAASSAGVARPNGIATGPFERFVYFNTISHGWGTGNKTELFLRRLKLLTLSEVLSESMRSGDGAAVEAAYRGYTTTRSALTGRDYQDAQNTAYALLREGNAASALRLFRLNTEFFPQRDAAWYHLGEGYRFTSDIKRAIDAYEKALSLNPASQPATTRLNELKK